MDLEFFLIHLSVERGETMLVLRTDITDLKDCMASIETCSELRHRYVHGTNALRQQAAHKA